MSDVNRQQEFLLLSRFNARDTEAFVSVYKLFFTELHLYASRLYNCTTVSPEDAVQDVFCSLLENKGTHFESLLKLKAFLYTSIKNRYKSYLEHRKVQGKYKTYTETAQTFASEITENEVKIVLPLLVKGNLKEKGDAFILTIDANTGYLSALSIPNKDFEATFSEITSS